jgi:MATE family multidrug resistance protein
MRRSHVWRAELLAQARLAAPIVLGQIGLYAMGAVDAAFMGRVSAEAFGAVALGHSLSFVLLGFGMGTLAALDPLVAQAHGAGEDEAVSTALQRGLVLALVLSAAVGTVLAFAGPILVALRQPPEVIPLAREYLLISIAGVPGFLLFVAQRQALQATHRLAALLAVIAGANVLNALLDWLLIEGALGLPAYGAAGCAWATVAARWVLALALPVVAGRAYRRRLLPLRLGLMHRAAFARLLHVGVPIGLSFALEIGAFAGVLVLMGRLGATQLAAHQVVMTLAAAAFMLPLGLSMAAAVRVGNAIGRGDPAGVSRAAHGALLLGAAVMSVSALAFLLVPMPLARLVTDLPPVLALAVTLLPIAGVFQVFDGVQAVAMGCLRGMADTRVPLAIHVVGFWGIAIPVSAWLGLRLELGARGLWWGLALGLALVAVVQVWRLRVKLRAGVVRFRVDEPVA